MACRLRDSRESRTPERRSCLSKGMISGMGFMQPSLPGRAATPPPAAGSGPCRIGGGEGKTVGRIGERTLIQALVQDALNCPVSGVVKEQGSSTGTLQAYGPVLFRETDDPLGGPQVVQYPVGKQTTDQFVTLRADRLCLMQTPLGVLHLVGDGFRGQVSIHGGAGAGSVQAGVTATNSRLWKSLTLLSVALRPEL